MESNKYKISFCTVCMNRLHHLRKTLPFNIADNENYKNLEFVVLDYNSSDALEEYMKNEMSLYINHGRLIYYKTLTPVYFNRSHSRNLACKLASGDIIVNLDADNFTGKNFAAYINNEFQNNKNIYLSALGGKQDVLGRVCIKKEDFYKIKGYDERMIYYGFEDYDFANRLEFNGLKNIRIALNEGFLNAIAHPDKERLSNEYVTSNLDFILLNYITPAATEIIYFFKHGEFKKGIIVSNKTYHHTEPLTELRRSQIKYTYSILSNNWINGRWKYENDKLILLDDQGNAENLFNDKISSYFTLKAKNGAPTFYKLTDADLSEVVVLFFSQITNRLIMDNNKINKRVVVNHGDFGADTVYRNFDYQTPVIV